MLWWKLLFFELTDLNGYFICHSSHILAHFMLVTVTVNGYFWHCSHTVQADLYNLTVSNGPSICLSHLLTTTAVCSEFAAVALASRRYRLTLAATEHPAAWCMAVQRSAKSVSRVTLSADIGSWTQACNFCYCCGGMYICADFKNLDMKIGETRSELKEKVNKLRDLEHKEELHGFSLNPLSKEEMAAVQNVLWAFAWLFFFHFEVQFIANVGLLWVAWSRDVYSYPPISRHLLPIPYRIPTTIVPIPYPKPTALYPLPIP